jgi:hypothetical protein
MFHFQASATTRIDEADRSVHTVNGAAGLTILPHADTALDVRIVSGQHQPLQGWVPAGWGKHRPAPVAIYSAEADLPLAIDTVLYPYPKDEAPQLRLERLDIDESSEPVPSWEASGLCIHIDARRDYYLAAHERRALRRFGPIVCDGEIALLRCAADGTLTHLSLVNGSYVELEGQTIVTAEHTFDTLELTWAADTLELHCHPQIGATLWSGTAQHLCLNGEDPQAISPTDKKIRVFEDWLD